MLTNESIEIINVTQILSMISYTEMYHIRFDAPTMIKATIWGGYIGYINFCARFPTYFFTSYYHIRRSSLLFIQVDV